MANNEPYFPHDSLLPPRLAVPCSSQTTRIECGPKPPLWTDPRGLHAGKGSPWGAGPGAPLRPRRCPRSPESSCSCSAVAASDCRTPKRAPSLGGHPRLYLHPCSACAGAALCLRLPSQRRTRRRRRRRHQAGAWGPRTDPGWPPPRCPQLPQPHSACKA
jgi:hypothetical protein